MAMRSILALALALIATALPSLASAQALPMEAAAKPKPPRSTTVLGTLIYITARLSRDETWVYSPATNEVTACCWDVATGKPPTARLSSPARPAPQEATSPIRGVGIVVKKNGPPYPSARVAPPATSPVPVEAVNPIRGVGVVIKRNPGSSAERTSASAADGSATFDGAPAPGSYDVSVTLPADAEAGMPAPVSLTFQVIVAADGTAKSSHNGASWDLKKNVKV